MGSTARNYHAHGGKGYNQPAYDTATHQYTVQWTWCLYEEAMADAP